MFTPDQGLPPNYVNTTGNVIFTPYAIESRSAYITGQVMPVTPIVNSQHR